MNERVSVETRRGDLLEIAAILLVMLIAIVIVRPLGDFPINDDENHAIGTWNFARDGHFKFAIDTTPPLRAQVVWGAAWTRLFGESFDVLRASTLFLSGLTLILIDRILGLAGIRRSLRVVATLAFLFNPLFFWSANTYMTEAPFVFASVAAFYAYARGLREERMSWMVAGVIATAVSWWIRQGIVNVFPPAALLIIFRSRLTKRWKSFLALLAATAIGYAAMGLLRPDLVVASPAEFHYHYQMWLEPSFRITDMVELIASYVFFNLQHTALFFLPLTVAAAFALRIDRRWKIAVTAISALFFVGIMTKLVLNDLPLPYDHANLDLNVSAGNIFNNFGIGPRTLSDVWAAHHEYSFHLPMSVRIALSYFSVLLAAAMTAILIFATRERFSDPRADVVFLLAIFNVLIGTLLLAVSGQYIDRYAIDTAWPAAIALAILVPWGNVRARVAAIAALVIICVFSVLGVQEYFAWNRARWDAYWQLRNHGATIKEIDGGAEPYLFFELSQARTQRERRVMAFGPGDRKYVLTFSPLPGYRVAGMKPYRGWLGLEKGAIYILERTR